MASWKNILLEDDLSLHFLLQLFLRIFHIPTFFFNLENYESKNFEPEEMSKMMWINAINDIAPGAPIAEDSWCFQRVLDRSW